MHRRSTTTFCMQGSNLAINFKIRHRRQSSQNLGYPEGQSSPLRALLTASQCAAQNTCASPHNQVSNWPIIASCKQEPSTSQQGRQAASTTSNICKRNVRIPTAQLQAAFLLHRVAACMHGARDISAHEGQLSSTSCRGRSQHPCRCPAWCHQWRSAVHHTIASTPLAPHQIRIAVLPGSFACTPQQPQLEQIFTQLPEAFT